MRANFDLKLSQPAAPGKNDNHQRDPGQQPDLRGGGTFTGASREGAGRSGATAPGPSGTTGPRPPEPGDGRHLRQQFSTLSRGLSRCTFPLAPFGSNDDSGGDACGLKLPHLRPDPGSDPPDRRLRFQQPRQRRLQAADLPGPLVPPQILRSPPRSGTGFPGTVYIPGLQAHPAAVTFCEPGVQRRRLRPDVCGAGWGRVRRLEEQKFCLPGPDDQLPDRPDRKRNVHRGLTDMLRVKDPDH